MPTPHQIQNPIRTVTPGAPSSKLQMMQNYSRRTTYVEKVQKESTASPFAPADIIDAEK